MNDTAYESNQQSPERQEQRYRELRSWMVLNKVTFVDMGRAIGGITGNAVLMLVKRDRMPVHRHEALVRAYPSLPVELLPPGIDAANARKRDAGS